jgi:hypothetical protein
LGLVVVVAAGWASFLIVLWSIGTDSRAIWYLILPATAVFAVVSWRRPDCSGARQAHAVTSTGSGPVIHTFGCAAPLDDERAQFPPVFEARVYRSGVTDWLRNTDAAQLIGGIALLTVLVSWIARATLPVTSWDARILHGLRLLSVASIASVVVAGLIRTTLWDTRIFVAPGLIRVASGWAFRRVEVLDFPVRHLEEVHIIADMATHRSWFRRQRRELILRSEARTARVGIQGMDLTPLWWALFSAEDTSPQLLDHLT